MKKTKIMKYLNFEKSFSKKMILNCLLLALLYSCKKADTSSVEMLSKNADVLYQTLVSSGVRADMIKDLEGYYLVENDLLFKKGETDIEKVKLFFGNPQKTSNADQVNLKAKSTNKGQTRTPDIIANKNAELIAYQCDFVDYYWTSAVEKALGHWANVSNTKLNFYPLKSGNTMGNQILFTFDNGVLPDYVIAAAEFPSNGLSGFRVRINPDFNSNMSVSDAGKIYNMVHEIGHCLGLRHTNWQINGEQQQGAIQISGTPSSDPNSVMNGGTALNLWNGFSNYDIVAAQTLYPYSSLDNWITVPERKIFYNYVNNYIEYSSFYISENTDPIEIKWNKNLVNTRSINLYLYQNNQMVRVIATNVANTGVYSTSIANYLPSNDGHFYNNIQVKIQDSGNQNSNDYSSYFSIQVD
ncbi:MULTISPECIES: M57 family metalloprotease [Sphingobacterium]|nr:MULTISPECIES: M57 family metalloprotease [Sphingobacterium]